MAGRSIFERLNRDRLQQTKDAIEQQRQNANPISRWAQECLDNNAIELDKGPYKVAMRFSLGTRVATPWLYQSFTSYCRRQGIRPPSRRAFGQACTRMFGPRQHVEDGGKRPRGYDIPKQEIWQDILNNIWKQWPPLRPGQRVNYVPPNHNLLGQ